MIERNIKAIPQRHLGFLYRSRTEARWAEFFHLSGIPVSYEEDGYQTDIGWYVPDFRFIHVERPTFFEVKPTRPTPGEYDILSALARSLEAHAFVAHGNPSCQCRIEKVYRDGTTQEWFFAYEHEGVAGYLVDDLDARQYEIAIRTTKNPASMGGMPPSDLDCAGHLRFGHDADNDIRPNERRVEFKARNRRVDYRRVY